MNDALDPRLNAFRADLADVRLRAKVATERYVAGAIFHVVAPIAPVLAEPDAGGALETEVLCGETVQVFDVADGFAWCQAVNDAYVGYVPEDALAVGGGVASPGKATHRVSALATHAYAEPKATARAGRALLFGSVLRASPVSEEWVECAGGGFVPARQLTAIGERAGDHVATALRFVGAPYVFGGKSIRGIDCSGLVQLALEAAGMACPRDTDMQEKRLSGALGVDEDILGRLQRGDLVYWPRHVGIMIDATRLVHASGTLMCTGIEAVAAVAARSRGDGPVVSAVKRLQL